MNHILHDESRKCEKEELGAGTPTSEEERVGQRKPTRTRTRTGPSSLPPSELLIFRSVSVDEVAMGTKRTQGSAAPWTVLFHTSHLKALSMFVPVSGSQRGPVLDPVLLRLQSFMTGKP